jgi:uncharacterized protein (DUF2141 family)
MHRLFIAIAIALAALFVAACDSSNVVTPDSGEISGSLTVDGPFNGSSELLVGLFEGETVVETATAGRITSAANATLNGRAIAFSFTEVDFGSYTVRLYSSSAGNNTYYFTSDPIVLSASNPEVDDFSEHASFTGEGPFGSISGVALLSDDFEFPGAGELAFIGFSPVSDPQNAYQWIVGSGDAEGGQLVFNIDGIAYGTWLVGLYGYNPQTHAVTVFGLLDEPVVVGAGNPNVTGAIFGADSDGDPGADPQLGTINGTVTFNGALPVGQSIFVAANTIPPQQGAPLATQEVTSLDGRTFDYSLPLLPNGEYSVSIFSYDFANHQAVYFGEYDGSVSVTEADQTVDDADFSADVTTIGGTAD